MLFDIIQTLRRGKRADVEMIHKKYSEITRQKSVTGPFLILSFDCDTPLDAAAAKTVGGILEGMGVPAVFAVPGRRIEDDIDAYNSLSQKGFEFLNHGYLEHAAYNTKHERYESITWYHEMGAHAVSTDINRGHSVLTSLLGVKPEGFRPPHFGHYQEPQQLGLVYRTISDLGYRYSSSTIPAWAFTHGALCRVDNAIIEFPVTGTYDWPNIILDSWQFLAAPDRTFTPGDYVKQFKKLVDYYTGHQFPCILNLYTDPSHIVKFQGFFDCIAYALSKSVKPTTYSRLLDDLGMLKDRECAG